MRILLAQVAILRMLPSAHDPEQLSSDQRTHTVDIYEHTTSHYLQPAGSQSQHASVILQIIARRACAMHLQLIARAICLSGNKICYSVASVRALVTALQRTCRRKLFALR